MARRSKYNRKRRQGRFSFLYRILIFVAICGAIAVALALFFKVETISVNGNSRYTTQQIIDAGGIETGDNMFFLNKYTASERITASLPYVETVRISRQLPDTLVITVTECTAPAAIAQDSKLGLLSGASMTAQEYVEWAAQTLPGDLAACGLTDVEVQITAQDLAAERDCPTLLVTAQLQDMPMYERMVCIQSGDYIYCVTLCSFTKDVTADMAALFHRAW